MNIFEQAEKDIKPYIESINDLCYKNSLKVLNAFIENGVSTYHFNSTDGYGYNDDGREWLMSVKTKLGWTIVKTFGPFILDSNTMDSNFYYSNRNICNRRF